METEIKPLVQEELDERVKFLILERTMNEDEWIDKHSSGTLRKNKKIGFAYRDQYLHERIAYEFGYGFECLPKTRISFGDPRTEGDCKAITKAGWFIERYINRKIFDDKIEAKYIYAEYSHGKNKEGVGIIVRSTSAPWVPKSHIIFSIIAEYDKDKDDFNEAINPF